jgi:hypothetical protein
MSAKSIEPRHNYLNISEAAVYVGVSINIMRGWLDDNIIPFTEFPQVNGTGKKRFLKINKADLDNFMDQHYEIPKNILHSQRTPEAQVSLTLDPR